MFKGLSSGGHNPPTNAFKLTPNFFAFNLYLTDYNCYIYYYLCDSKLVLIYFLYIFQADQKMHGFCLRIVQ